MTTDNFDALQLADEPIRPPTGFVAALRDELREALGLTDASASTPADDPTTTDLPVVALPLRRRPMPTATTIYSATTPYLAVHDGPAALAFYVRAFGAEERTRFVGDDGRVGHAELTFGPARIYLSDEYPEIGVMSPRTLGGTTVTINVEVDDVDDIYRRAVEAGATAVAEPADQAHGNRHGTLIDPFGHRWLLAQPIEDVSASEVAARMGAQGWTVEHGAGPATAPAHGGIWSSVNAADAPALIGFMVDVFGFVADLVVPGESPDVIVHSQLRWPEGGIVQVGSAGRDHNPFSQRPTGSESLYVITSDPDRVYRRCLDAGVRVVAEPRSADYDPQGSVFTVADAEGNLWSFGTYAG